MSTCLITGGAGFIGSHLAEGLLKSGHRVIVIDDLSTGRIENIAHLQSDSCFRFVHANAGSRAVLADLVHVADVVFHLAATVGVFHVIDTPVATIDNNVGTTMAVLEAAAKRRKKLIVASTSEVYGKSEAVPFREDGDLTLGPTCRSRWGYAASKIVDEFLALAFWEESRVPTVVVRLFNTIGPRQLGRYGMVVPRFLEQALGGHNLTVYGTGQQSRCFTYVSDVVQWLMLLAEHDGALGGVFNLGTPQEVTILELARRVIQVTKADVGIDFVPYDEAYRKGFDDMQRRVPDITRVTSLTGYWPRVGLEEALQRTRDWMLTRDGAAAATPPEHPRAQQRAAETAQ